METFYNADHLYLEVKEESGTALIGITDYAQGVLGEIVFADLPAVGTVISKGDSLVTLESSKVATDLDSPISGKVLTINAELSSTPALINSSPEDKGWLCVIQISDYEELQQDFMSKDAYTQLLKSL